MGNITDALDTTLTSDEEQIWDAVDDIIKKINEGSQYALVELIEHIEYWRGVKGFEYREMIYHPESFRDELFDIYSSALDDAYSRGSEDPIFEATKPHVL